MPRIHRRGLSQINRHVMGVVLISAISVDDGNAVAVELLLVDEVTKKWQSCRRRNGISELVEKTHAAFVFGVGVWSALKLYLNDESLFSFSSRLSSRSPRPLFDRDFRMVFSMVPPPPSLALLIPLRLVPLLDNPPP